MGLKQDAWDAEVAAFDAGRTAYETARDTMLAQWTAFNTFLTDFLGGTDKTQAEWDAEVLALRRATMTKAARSEGGVIVRPAETQASFASTRGPLETALLGLEELTAQYDADPDVPNNVKAAMRRIGFGDYFIFNPAGLAYQRRDQNGNLVTSTIKAPHWWAIPNQFSGLIIRGRGEPTVEDDPANARGKLATLTPTIDDTALFTVRDDCAAIAGID
jgi:hypothetical protein